MFNLLIVIVAAVIITLLFVAFKAVGEGTRVRRFAQGGLGIVALLVGTFSISLIF